eukprot:6465818-Amphidinium_carterae.1
MEEGRRPYPFGPHEPLRQQGREPGTHEISSDEDKGLLQLIHPVNKDEQGIVGNAASSGEPRQLPGQDEAADTAPAGTSEPIAREPQTPGEDRPGDGTPEAEGGIAEVLRSAAPYQPHALDPETTQQEVLQPESAEQLEETTEGRTEDSTEAQEKQPATPAPLAPAHPRPKWAIRQAEQSDEPAPETPIPDKDEETRDMEVRKDTPSQEKQDLEKVDPELAATGIQEVLVTKDWPAMSSLTTTVATQQAEERTLQEDDKELPEDEVMQAIALLRSKGYAVEAQEKEAVHVSPSVDLVSLDFDCDYATYIWHNHTPSSGDD